MIVKERLCEELKKAQLSLVNETDVNTKIYYSWDHIPEKLTPGHRQRGKDRVELHCLPFYIIRNGKKVYSHWDGEKFENKVPHWSDEIAQMFMEICSIWLSKSKWKGHIRENRDDVFHDAYLFLLRRSAMLDLDRYNNPVPQFLFWLSNQSKLVSKNYFSCAPISLSDIEGGEEKITNGEWEFGDDSEEDDNGFLGISEDWS